MSYSNDAEQTRQALRADKPSPLWLLGGAAVFAVGIASFAFARASSPTETATITQLASLIEVAPVSATDNRFLVHAPGRLAPRQQLTVVGEVAGKIVETHPALTLGGRIRKGELIVRIDAGDFRADLARADAGIATAQARLAQAEAELARQESLAAIGATPEKARESAVAAFKDAQAGLSQARAQRAIAESGVSKTTIRAPFDAIVISENVTLGSYVAPGLELARLIDAGSGEIVAGLPQRDVVAVRNVMQTAPETGLTVRAIPNESSISGKSLTGYIDQFSPRIDPASRTVSIVAVFPDAFAAENQGLVFADDFMTLEIEALSPEPLYAIPTGALRQDSFVWIVRDGHFIERVDVRAVDRQGDRILVSSAGLSGTENIMVTVLSEEIDGMQVRVEGAGE